MSNTLKSALIVGVASITFIVGLFLIGPAMVVLVFALGFVGVLTWAVKEELDRRDSRKSRRRTY